MVIDDLTQEGAIRAIRLASSGPDDQNLPVFWVRQLLAAYDQNEAALSIARDGQRLANERLDAVTTEMIEWRRKHYEAMELVQNLAANGHYGPTVTVQAVVPVRERANYGQSVERVQLAAEGDGESERGTDSHGAATTPDPIDVG